MTKTRPLVIALSALCLGGWALMALHSDGDDHMAKAGDGGRATVKGSGTSIGGDGGSISADAAANSRGGDGGDAHAEGKQLAIGGPGGRVAGTAPGLRGGRGGSTAGSVGNVVVGGGGGHVAGPGVWLPPARSGYEVHQRKLGLPVDPFMAQFGRGAAMPGYAEKLTVVDQVRADYLNARSAFSPQAMFDVRSVPLDHINGALAAMNAQWRARIVDDQFEFFAI